MCFPVDVSSRKGLKLQEPIITRDRGGQRGTYTRRLGDVVFPTKKIDFVIRSLKVEKDCPVTTSHNRAFWPLPSVVAVVAPSKHANV